MKSDKLRGTVDCTKHEDGTVTSDPEKVLKAYTNWGTIPKVWGDHRAAELALAARYALSIIAKYKKEKKRESKN